MQLPASSRPLFLSLIALCFCAAQVDAQSPPTPNSCCPRGASDKPGSGQVSPIIIISDVAFEGTIHLPDSGLQQVVLSLKQREFEGNSNWLEEIEGLLRSPWMDEGYFKVKIVAQALPLGGDGAYQRYAIKARADEGPQYRLGRIEFRADSKSNPNRYENNDGVTVYRRETSDDGGPLMVTLTDPPVFSAEELRILIPLQDGDILSADKIRDGLAALGKPYGEHGYIDFVAAPLTDIDDEHQIVSLTIDLIEDKQFRIGQIEVSGLVAKLQNALTWNIKTGDVFDSRMFEKFFETNQSVLPSGASMSKNSRLNRNIGNGTVDVVFNFSPCPSQ
jgi:hypothetical protein